MKHPAHSQAGASLIEVLVALLILSFGMLSLGGMLSYAVQMPRLAGFRSTAVAISAGHIERMRANIAGFTTGDNYKETMTYQGTLPTVTPCVHPACTPALLAALDKNETNRALRRELPGGDAGMRLICTGAASAGSCAEGEGEMWILWLEPASFATLGVSTTDECPLPTVAPTFTAFTPTPRCLHVKFKL